MPYELIVQAAFEEAVEGGPARKRSVGDHIHDQDQIDAIQSQPNLRTHVVQVWSDDVAEAEPVAQPAATSQTDADKASAPPPAAAPASA